MTMRAIATLGLSALVLGGTMVGCAGGGIASASSRSADNIARQAAVNAAKADKALKKGDAIKAVSFAEAAVALLPRDAGFRTLLASSYLKAGRFASAQAAFADALSLSPDNGTVALNLALAQIAEGHWDEARATIDAHRNGIAASDRGLALALAGDPTGAVEVLMTAARSPEADGKTRQNLALALALAGRWQDSRSLLGVDMAPVQADERIVEWAAFARPAGAADQVAALLGVVPVKDPGVPVALALSRPAPVAVAAADPVEAEGHVAAGVVGPATPATGLAESPNTAPVVASATPGFGPRVEVVQPLPVGAAAPAIATIAATTTFKTRLKAAAPAAMPAARGDWYVQIGAYDSVAVARDSWARVKRRLPGGGALTPTGMTIKTATGEFYRLSIGGFARGDAKALCRSYSARGGKCFVRMGAGDRVAQWVKPGVQLASR